MVGSFSLCTLDTSPQGLIRSQFTFLLSPRWGNYLGAFLPLFWVLYNMLLFSFLQSPFCIEEFLFTFIVIWKLLLSLPTVLLTVGNACVYSFFVDKASCSPGWLELRSPFFVSLVFPTSKCTISCVLKVIFIHPLTIWLLCRSLHVGQFGMNFSEHGLYFSILCISHSGYSQCTNAHSAWI